jgi:hypothetical protein
MGADIYLQSARDSGGYFRNGYNSGDIMWAMGLSWHGTVAPMLDEGLDEGRCLPIPRARELVEMIEARPLTRERVGRHIFENMTGGVESHPFMSPRVQMLERRRGGRGAAAEGAPGLRCSVRIPQQAPRRIADPPAQIDRIG